MKHRFVILLLTTLFIFYFFSISSAGPIKYTVGGHAAAVSEDVIDRVIDLSISKDYAALQQLIDSGLVIILKKGIKVEVVDTKIFSGKAKIRPFGTNITLWTVIEAIE